MLEVNVIGTGAVLAAARECGTDPTDPGDQLGRGLRRGDRPGAASRSTEDSPTAPLTPYAASKLAAEALAAQAFLGHGQQVITVRPFNHIGPGQTPNFAVAALAKRIVEAERPGRTDHPGRQSVGPA